MKKILPFALIAGLVSAPLAQAKMNSGGQTYASLSAGYGTADISTHVRFLTTRHDFSIGGRGYIASLSLGHFLDAASTANKAFGFEGVAERSNVAGKQSILASIPVLAPELRLTFGGLLVGKYSFSPNASFMLKGGPIVSRWDFRSQTGGTTRVHGTQLTGIRAALASEFKVNDEVYMTVAGEYTQYKTVRTKHQLTSTMYLYKYTPKVLAIKLGVTRYFTI